MQVVPGSRNRARAPLAAVLGVGLLLAALPAAAQQIAPPKLPFEKYVLPNGLAVVLHEDHSTPIVAVNLWYHVGSKNERRGKTGFAHLFEHMMFQGSQHHDTDFFKAMEPLGATGLNGSTEFDRTNYFETVPSNALETAVWLEADRMGWLLPSMTQERIDNQKDVVKNERRQSVDNQPYGTVDERMYAVLYPSNHPYSWDVIGSMDDLTAASKADVEDFFKTYYTPGNCTLVIAGDLDPAKTKSLVEKYFGPIPAGPPVARTQEWIPELSKEVRLTMEDRVPLPRLYIAWHAPARFRPGDADLSVLAGILAGRGEMGMRGMGGSASKTSRLYRRLVYDLKIASDVSAQVDNREIGSLFWIQVTAREGHTLAEIEPIVFEEVQKLRDKGPTPDEVERVRTGILAGFTRGLERIGGFGGKSDRLAMYNTFTGDPGYLDKDFARYQAVTPKSVQEAASRWLHQGRAVMTVNPFPTLHAAKEPEGLDRSAAPSLGTPPPLQLPALQHAKLSNGLEVVLAEAHKVPAVELNLLVGGGYSADRKDKPGVASFMARMQDEGTLRRSSLQISEEAQRLGASLGTSSSLDNCRVRLNALEARLQPSLELWADVVLNPSFPPDEIERQRQEMLSQIQQEKTQPMTMGMRLLPGLLYGDNHPYGQPLTGSGTETSVKAITHDDLVAFHGTWFKPNNARLVVVGDTKLAEIVPLLEKALGGWKPSDVPAITIPERAQPAQTTVYLIDKPGAAQSVLLMGQLMPSKSDPEDLPFRVLNTVLGGQFTSRINMNLREDKGYTYGARTSPVDARGQGMFVASTQVRTDVTKESISEIMKEMREIRATRPVTAEEVREAQDNMTLSLPAQYETMGGIAGKIADIATYGLPEDYYSTYPERVRATTVESLTNLAVQRLQPEHLAVVVVGDRQKVEPGIVSLHLGTIEYLDADGRPLPQSADRK